MLRATSGGLGRNTDKCCTAAIVTLVLANVLTWAAFIAGAARSSCDGFLERLGFGDRLGSLLKSLVSFALFLPGPERAAPCFPASVFW